MKYLKNFETRKISYKYDIGDYIILQGSNSTGKILIHYNEPNDNNPVHWNYGNQYRIEFFLNDLVKLWFTESHITRKATDDEIEEFEMKKQSFKYNI